MENKQNPGTILRTQVSNINTTTDRTLSSVQTSLVSNTLVIWKLFLQISLFLLAETFPNLNKTKDVGKIAEIYLVMKFNWINVRILYFNLYLTHTDSNAVCWRMLNAEIWLWGDVAYALRNFFVCEIFFSNAVCFLCFQIICNY